MKVPKSFRSNKNLDKKLKQLLNGRPINPKKASMKKRLSEVVNNSLHKDYDVDRTLDLTMDDLGIVLVEDIYPKHKNYRQGMVFLDGWACATLKQDFSTMVIDKDCLSIETTKNGGGFVVYHPDEGPNYLRNRSVLYIENKEHFSLNWEKPFNAVKINIKDGFFDSYVAHLEIVGMGKIYYIPHKDKP